MFKHKRSQSGFGIVEALCFIVMFSMVGLIGWYVINENQNSQETLDNIGGAEVQTSSSKPATAGDKFVFKELGVQITVPDALKGLSYRAESGTSVTGEPTTFLYLTSANFKSFLDSCKSNDPSAVFGAISKTKGKYPSEQTFDNVDGALMRQFDDFYVSGSAAQQANPCSEESLVEDLKNIRSAQFSNLTEAFKTATLVE